MPAPALSVKNLALTHAGRNHGQRGGACLLADEPLSGLDLPLRDTVLPPLNRPVCQEGLGLLLVTLALTTAATMCGTTAVLSQSSIVEEAPTGQVLENAAGPAAIALVQASRGPQLPDPLQAVAL